MPYLLLLLLLIPFLSQANEHIFMPLVAYHLDQKTLPGYGLNYQYQYSESFEFDIGIIHSSDLELLKAQQKILGNYTSVFIGTTFLKPYNDDLSIKAGIGLSYSLASSNQQLIANNNLAPYIKLSAKYKLNAQIYFEVGQISSFSSGELGNNHSFFFGIAWIFTTSNNSSVTKHQSPVIKPKLVNRMQHDKVSAPVKLLPLLNTTNNKWTVQLAAFQNRNNANEKRLALQQLFNSKGLNTQLVVVNINYMYKLVTSKMFTHKSDAKVAAKSIYDMFAIKSFVTSTNHAAIIND
ncbi:MAG: hypothetical protein ACI9LM_002661 [Alteromonadaceae bacterium]|jgi:hypothetical protein